MGILPKVRGENKKYLSCHHLVYIYYLLTKYTTPNLWNGGVFEPRVSSKREPRLSDGLRVCIVNVDLWSKCLDQCRFCFKTTDPPPKKWNTHWGFKALHDNLDIWDIKSSNTQCSKIPYIPVYCLPLKSCNFPTLKPCFHQTNCPQTYIGGSSHAEWHTFIRSLIFACTTSTSSSMSWKTLWGVPSKKSCDGRFYSPWHPCETSQKSSEKR